MLVKYSSLAGGSFIEVVDREGNCYLDSDRVFRPAGNGAMEWAFYGDVIRDGELVRWYGCSLPASQFEFA